MVNQYYYADMNAENITKRIDGEESRKRIMMNALRLFAEHGYQATSTRQIAKEANVNISAIAYYFGDKAGLYRAVFEMSCDAKEDIKLFIGEELSLEQALNGMFSGFTEPLKQGELAKLSVRLHMREMVEPTGLWAAEIDNSIVPHHHALLKVLQRHLNLQTIDADLQRLAFCIVAMGVHLYVGRDVTERVAPELMVSDLALDAMRERITYFALSMVQAEALRRKSSKHA